MTTWNGAPVAAMLSSCPPAPRFAWARCPTCRAPMRSDGTACTGAPRHLSPTTNLTLYATFLTAYYSGGGTSAGLDAPTPTVVTKDRLGLVTVTIDGEPYTITDIAMRMLTPRELARAQGFPDSYVLTGTKSEQIARIGNSVSPYPAEALVRANLAPAPAGAMAAK